MSDESYHVPVLLRETVDLLLNPEISKHIIVDGTLGGGGYTEEICRKISDDSRVIGIDKDVNALEFSSKRLKKFGDKVVLKKGNFAEVKSILQGLGISSITGIVLDLGLSSFQLESEEGFSFMKDTRLDMRADKDLELTAANVLNKYSEDELNSIFVNYGEIGNSGRLVDAIIKQRSKEKFEYTNQLIKLIESEYIIDKKNKIKFLAKIFQSLRIEVNGELNDLKKVLTDSTELLEKGGRIAIVSYHSLEDRIVKDFFKENSYTEKVSKYKLGIEVKTPLLKLVNKKVVVPTYEEVKSNSRARSAKLRVAEKN
ncbi:MAG TPA: 16S rRNA (cytosine(1402)-N(4))-methyltransferase RsmH [Ignavibacteria bacterium]|nr:16S rRNA (cytosine(1402)-N(4))-methyltransferase RsmH [Ignavibacteria bacterium]